VPSEEDSYSVAGVYLHRAESGHVRFVSIDGHRLAYYEFPFGEFPSIELGEGIIVPRKGVQEILRLLEKEQEDCFIGLDERFLIVKTASAFLSVQLLEGGFPAYDAIIPEERPYTFTADRDVFHSALRRMAVVTSQKWRHAQLRLSENQLEMMTENPETGSGSDALDVEYSGEDFIIAFNVKYLLDAVEAMEGQKVVVEWVDDVHGGIFHSPDDPGLLALVMPMVV
jgi:DNA polymerase-3 subunit beta